MVAIFGDCKSSLFMYMSTDCQQGKCNFFFNNGKNNLKSHLRVQRA